MKGIIEVRQGLVHGSDVIFKVFVVGISFGDKLERKWIVGPHIRDYERAISL